MRSLSKSELLLRTRKLINDMKGMPYYDNFNNNKHETAIEGILNLNGIKSWNTAIDINTTMVWSWIKDPESAHVMPGMTYMKHPCGSQSSPDFLVKLEEGVLFGLECKSSKTTTCPMFNSGGVKEQLIYIYCSKVTNETTLFKGGDILTEAQKNVIDELIIKQKELEKEYNSKLKRIDVNKRGVYVYSRPMICQEGGNAYTNYFTHQDKENCEKNVLKFVEGMIDESYQDYFDSIV